MLETRRSPRMMQVGRLFSFWRDLARDDFAARLERAIGRGAKMSQARPVVRQIAGQRFLRMVSQRRKG